VDGTAGLVASNPTPERLADFEQRFQAESRRRKDEIESAARPASTTDGYRLKVLANAGSVQDARNALEFGAEGIGLLRTEFLFLNRSRPPDEQAQYAAYRTIFELMETRPVVVRTLDIGGDKELPYYDFGAEANPYLGYRAIRISLDHPSVFKLQLRAVLRAGVGHDLRLMFPMIATLDEFRKAKKLLEEARAELRREEIATADDLQVGIMMEIPSVALLADQFAPEVDFFSIGTNDLTQYTFAAERGNRRVSHLNDSCHPAILRQIERVVQAAHRQGKWVGVCGEMAGDAEAVPILLGLGVDELSMAPARIPSSKRLIREWSLVDALAVAGRALDLESAEDIRRLVKS
jgi:phosphoenolpyruvate-protein phosphotransferase